MRQIDNSHDKGDEIEKTFLSLYRKKLSEIIKEVIYFKGSYTKEQYYNPVGLDNLSGLAYGVRTNLDSLKYSIEKLMNELLEEETDQLEEHLSGLYLGIFDDNIWLDNAINKQWCGANFKETLEANNKQFIFNLNRTILGGLIRGESNKKLKDNITGVINGLNKRTNTVMRTETTYITNQAIIDKGINEGYTKYMYLAYIDNKTCSHCRALNGTTGVLEKAKIGVDIPPIHQHCRCTIEIIK